MRNTPSSTMLTGIAKRLTAAVMAFALAGGLTGCGVSTAGGTGPHESFQSADAAAASPAALAEISLEGLDPYEVQDKHEISIAGADDMKAFILKQAYGAAVVGFYRAQNGDINGAYQAEGGTLYRLCRVYNASEHSGYQEGFSIDTYQDLFGHDGFIMGYGIGAAYQAFEYYYLDDTGAPAVLAQTYNMHRIRDLDRDGADELVTFYSITNSPYIYYMKDQRLYMVDVIKAVTNKMPRWERVSSGGEVTEDGSGKPYISLLYSTGGNSEIHEAAVYFTPESLELCALP